MKPTTSTSAEAVRLGIVAKRMVEEGWERWDCQVEREEYFVCSFEVVVGEVSEKMVLERERMALICDGGGGVEGVVCYLCLNLRVIVVWILRWRRGGCR